MGRTALKAPAVAAAQTREEAETAVALIGELRRELTRRKTILNDQVATLQSAADEAARPLQADIEALQAQVQLYCEANRKALTNEGRTKTVLFATGKVAWRARPPSVSLRGVEAIIAYLKAAKGGLFIRTKEEIDKEAMLADPETARTVPGVKIGSEGEDFVIEPSEVPLAGAD